MDMAKIRYGDTACHPLATGGVATRTNQTSGCTTHAWIYGRPQNVVTFQRCFVDVHMTFLERPKVKRCPPNVLRFHRQPSDMLTFHMFCGRSYDASRCPNVPQMSCDCSNVSQMPCRCPNIECIFMGRSEIVSGISERSNNIFLTFMARHQHVF